MQMFAHILIPNQFALRVYLNLFGGEQVKHVFRLQPTSIKLLQFFIIDIAIPLHHYYPSLGVRYSSSESEF